ncbi:MAG TPA: hypothetical protein VGL81_34185 [Polyangiaceae bacterium]
MRVFFSEGSDDDVELAVVVAVRPVRVVQMATDEVIDVVAVGNGLVAAARSVLVVRGVLRADMPSRAIRLVGGADGEGVLVDVITVHVVKVTVVQKVLVAVVANADVTTTGRVPMSVIGVGLTGHRSSPLAWTLHAVMKCSDT